MGAVSQTTFSVFFLDENVWNSIKISLKFVIKGIITDAHMRLLGLINYVHTKLWHSITYGCHVFNKDLYKLLLQDVHE